MKKKQLYMALSLLAAFALWTAALCFVDVQPLGPMGGKIGFATLNSGFHRFTGLHMGLYMLTDWLSLIPLGFVPGFGLLGLWQWIRGKSLMKVERSILGLGLFYVLVLAVYLFFELWVLNRRPVLIDGVAEASYPSSTTVLVLCVMSTARMQLGHRLKNPALRKGVAMAISAFSAFMVLGRLFSGVHWLSDIVGGVLLSAGLVLLYSACFAPEEKV